MGFGCWLRGGGRCVGGCLEYCEDWGCELRSVDGKSAKCVEGLWAFFLGLRKSIHMIVFSFLGWCVRV